jgi:hypothetical protein
MLKIVFHPFTFALGAGLFVASVHTGLPLHEVVRVIAEVLTEGLF